MNIKEYLNNFYWYDIPNDELANRLPDFAIAPEYPSNFISSFGNIMVNFLKIDQKFILFENYKKLEKLLLKNGFYIIERSMGSFKFINYQRKISIMGEITTVKKIEEKLNNEEIYDNEPAIISSSDEDIYIGILPSLDNKKFIEKIIKNILKCCNDVKTDKNKFYLISANSNGLYTQRTNFKVLPIKDDRYDIFYGKKFPHEKIKKFIFGKTENLLLLHGDPGTGKSNYIKNIIKDSPRPIIYIPPSMLGVISQPSFVSFIMKNAGSILLIEDAEEVLSIERNSATNNLLGITDGFLKDSLDLKIIATFNTDISKIDPALLRKGRMYFEYKFDKLSVDECVELSSFLNFEREINEPMTLSEFFNIDENSMENSFESRKIGFI